MSSELVESLAKPRFLLALMTVFACVARGLAAIGLYGVLSYAVTQRSREIGIRMALGARAADVLRAVFGEGMRLDTLGLVLGLPASAALARGVSALLFGITPHDSVVFVVVPAVLVVTSTVAVLRPARRASRVSPTIAMQAE